MIAVVSLKPKPSYGRRKDASNSNNKLKRMGMRRSRRPLKLP